MEVISEYLKTSRLYKTINFSLVVIGFLLFRPIATIIDVLSIIFLFLIFGVLIYGGLYSLNYIFDQRDKIIKKQISNVFCIAVANILLGLLLIFIFYKQIVTLIVLLCIINILYTILIRPYSLILAMILIATTGPIKVLIGTTLANGVIVNIAPLLISHYLSSVAFHALKNYYKNILSFVDMIKIVGMIIVLLIILTLISILIFKVYYSIIFVLFTVLNTSLTLKNNKYRSLSKYIMHIRTR